MAAQAAEGPAARRSVAAESLSVVALGAGRLVLRWPGLLAIPVSYAIAAALLYSHAYGYILSAVIAGAVGMGWYGSPLRKLEARRRDRESPGRT
jgi:hypothetical protein